MIYCYYTAGTIEHQVTQALMGSVFNFHGSLSRNNRQRGNHLKQGRSKLVTSDL